MAWVSIKGHLYYRRVRWVNGRVVSEHIGAGEFGRVTAEKDRQERIDARHLRNLVQAEHQLLLGELDALRRMDDLLAYLFGILAHRSGGLYRHRRQWRLRRGHTVGKENGTLAMLVDALGEPKKKGPLLEPDLWDVPQGDREMLRKASEGDADALTRAQQYVTQPKYYARWGSPMRHARIWLVTQVAGEDPVVAAAVWQQIASLNEQLGYNAAGALERFVITRIVNNWLAVGALEARANQHDPQARERLTIERCLCQAERRLLSSIRTLALLRRVKPDELADRLAGVRVVPAAAPPAVGPDAAPSPDPSPAEARPPAAARPRGRAKTGRRA